MRIWPRVESADLFLGRAPYWEEKQNSLWGRNPSVSTAIKKGPELSLQPLMTGLGVMNIYVLIKQANDCPHLLDPFHPHPFPNQKGPFWGLRPTAWWQPHAPAIRGWGPVCSRA